MMECKPLTNPESKMKKKVTWSENFIGIFAAALNVTRLPTVSVYIDKVSHYALVDTERRSICCPRIFKLQHLSSNLQRSGWKREKGTWRD